MTMPVMDNPFRLLRDLRGVVALHQRFGIEGYPKSQGLSKFLALPATLEQESSPPPGVRSLAEHKTPESREQGAKGVRQGLAEIRDTLGKSCRCQPDGAPPGRIVFGAGSPKAALLIVGDAPSLEDEANGTPFTGEAGELLTKMLKAIGLSREEVYLTTLVKCRAPGQAQSTPERVKSCLPNLLAQIEAVEPKILCTMGQLAAQTLLRTTTPLVRLRGRFHSWQQIPLMPTFDPAFLIKNPEMKRAAWIDLQQIQAKLNDLDS